MKKKTPKREPLVPLYVRVKQEHVDRLKARAKREIKSEGQVVRELFNNHLN